MPFGGYDDFQDCVQQNSDAEDPEAYCAVIEREIKGSDALSEEKLALAEDDPCWDGYEMVGTKVENGRTVPNCVPIEATDGREMRSFTLRDLEGVPLERADLGAGKVAYRHMKLLAPGIWTDAGSKSAAFYSPEGIRNLKADYDESVYDGPPVNIMHDVDMESGETNAPSVAGYVDPDSLDVDEDDNLYGDIILDTTKAAGAYADENLQSAFESQGRLGFGGPSVEIPARGLVEEYDPDRRMPRIKAGLLSGLGLVMNPASKTVSFAKEVARRGALLSGTNTKSFYLQRTLMDIEAMRETLEGHGIDTSDMDDESLMSYAESLHNDLMADLTEEDMEMEDDFGEIPQEPDENVDDSTGEDNVEYLDEEDEEDEEDDEEAMMDMHGDYMDEDEEEEEDDNMMANLRERIEALEDMMSQAYSMDDATKLTAKLSEAEETIETLNSRIQTLEEVEQDPKTLSDGSDWSDAQSSFVTTSTGTYSR